MIYIAPRAPRDRHNQRAPAATICPDSGVEGGVEPGTPRMETASVRADHAAKFDIAAAGLGGHRAKRRIQCRFCRGPFFCFFKLCRASLSLPPEPDPHVKTPQFAYTFHAWNFPKMQVDWTLSGSHLTSHGPLTIGAFKIWNPNDIHAANHCNLLIISIL